MNAQCERCGWVLASVQSDCAKCAAAGLALGDHWLGRVVAGRYRILRRIGRGGSAQVHEAVRLGDGLRVAVKSLRPDREGDDVGLTRILREARATMRVRHENVVELLDVGELPDGHLYLVLEYVDGPTIRSLLSSGPFDVARSLSIGMQVADALVAVHREGVVHRDLTPANIAIVTTRGREHAKLIDFGIASIALTVSITGSQQILGTPGYMAPEYVRDGRATPQSDQYSLGVLLYEMLSCTLPYDAASAGKMLVKQATESPIRLGVRVPTIAPFVEEIVMRAIERDPARRFPNLATLSAALENVRGKLVETAVRA